MKTKQILSALTVLVFGISTSNAQNVGVGTSTPAASAKLHIVDANRGLLIPNVALAAVNNGVSPVSAPAMGLLVWNTNAAVIGGSGTGYYYWDGAMWVRLLTSASNDWTLLGNAGTNPATNFLGTTDLQNLVFRTNNVERFRITTAGQMHGSSYGTAAAPVYSWVNDPNTGLFHNPALVDDLGLSTAGIQRLWISDAGEVYVGGTAPTLPGDMFNVTATNANAVTSGSGALSWAVNGYTAFNGGAVYGLRLAGATNTWGSLQGETTASNPASSSGVNGTVSAASHIGVRGFHPAGSGWGGIFYNDLGYTGGLFNASDRSLKKNVKGLTGALDLVTNIPIYSYEYKTDEYDVLGGVGEIHYGVMANELKTVLPDLVKTKLLDGNACKNCPFEIRDVEHDIEMVNYMELIPIALQAIKEQQGLIQEQAAQIEQLQKEVQDLKNK